MGGWCCGVNFAGFWVCVDICFRGVWGGAPPAWLLFWSLVLGCVGGTFGRVFWLPAGRVWFVILAR